ncbi:MAG: transcriptional repressor [Ruminiclostridium sp.]|nr:transcriptional repressor [Ruminiclostridium sp.]
MDKLNDSYLKECLQNSGCKITGPRKAVLQILEKYPDNHLSIDEIYEAVKKSYPKMGLATVYRTLALLENIGIVCKLDLDDGFSRYELYNPNETHRHHHLICSSCGSVSEVEEDLLDTLEKQILQKNKFLVKDHRVKFYGICEKCRA